MSRPAPLLFPSPVGGARRARRPPVWRRAIPWLVLGVGAATIFLGVRWDRQGYLLGAPHPPINAAWDPRSHPSAWLAVALFALSVLIARRLVSPRLAPALLALALLALTLVLRLALFSARYGPEPWARVFDLGVGGEAKNEYLAGLPALEYGPGFFLDRFAELVPSLPVHVAGHPPGIMLLIEGLGLSDPRAFAAVSIGAGALSAPLTYVLARAVLEEHAARVAGLLMALSPAALLFGVTSADALFLTVGLLAAWPLALASGRARGVGAVVLALASFFAWSLLAVGAWAVALALLREGWRPALRLALLCGVVLLALHGLVALWTGWDPLGTLRATSEVYRLGIASRRPYSFWLTGSPTAFLLALGLPLTWLALRGLSEGSAAALAIAAVILVAAVMGFTKAETERIWLFLVPFVCLAAAPVLARTPGWMTPVAALLGVQSLVSELCFGMPW